MSVSPVPRIPWLLRILSVPLILPVLPPDDVAPLSWQAVLSQVLRNLGEATEASRSQFLGRPHREGKACFLRSLSLAFFNLAAARQD